MSSLKKYRRVKYLGKGSYGAAILVELRSDPSKKFVIKEIVIGHLKPAEQAAAKSEAEVLHQMSHSNITGYVESFVENAKLYIVMEHADGGDLSGAIAKRKAEGKFFAEDEVMRIFVQICLALKHVHGANILHRDLKSQNIFLTLNGMVKLGDFGIAKVLDASEDQARTQIGTPYYLSPEICESKPYGRKSDVWSLGVVLFEILALEMPFQAQSLPALVVKICSGEPNYKPLEARYSSTLLTLTRSMLCKNPDKRPSVNQIVKTEFIMAHISRLLSYTLKMGTGGVAAPPEAPAVVDAALEQAKLKQKEIEAKEAADKAARRQEDREKLRQFRQNAAAKNKDREAGFNLDFNNDESKDNGSRRGGGSPVPSSRAKSPTPRPLSPRRAASPVRATSPLGWGGGRRVNSNSNLQVEAPVAKPTPRAAPVVQPQQQQQQQRAAGNGNSPMSLAEIQAQKQRSNAAAADAMRSNINANAGANSNNNRNRNMYEDRSNAMVVQHSNRDDQFESAARREYFANRAAAQAAKARVEADLHGGGDRVNIISGQPIPSRQASMMQQQQQQQGHARRNSEGEAYQQQQQPNSQRSSFDDHMDPEGRIAAIRAQKEKDRERELALKEMQLKQALEENREEGRNYKANREKRQAIAFDIDLSAGEVVNRPLPALNKKNASSSSHSSGSSGESKDVSPVPDAGSTKSRASVASNNSGNATPSSAVSSSSNRRRDDAKESDIEEDYESISSAANNKPVMVSDSRNSAAASPAVQVAAKAKKGWGPPVDPGEIQIAKGVAMYDADKAIASAMFEVPSSRRKSDGNSANLDAEVGRLRMDSLEEDELDDQTNGIAAGAGGVSAASSNDGEVRKFLANKRASLADQKNHARGLLLRLQKQAGKRRITRNINDAKEVHMMVASPTKADAKASAAAPTKLRMADIMKSVEAANESVQSAVAVNMNIKYGNARGDEKGDKDDVSSVSAEKVARRPSKTDGIADSKDSKMQYDEDVKAVAQLRDQYENIVESDDDLQDTLQSWLDKQKVGVTMRRGGAAGGHHHGSHATVPSVAAAEEVQEEEGLTGYDTTQFNQEVEEESDLSPPLLSTGAGRGVYLGNDVEVVGMQCMLAKALMGEGDSDDDSDFEDYNGVIKR